MELVRHSVAVITLDTSCVVALAHDQPTNDPREVEALELLMDLARQGTLGLQLTSAYERDFERFKDEAGRADRLAWLSKAPVIQRVGGIFRFDVSGWDGPDLLASPEDEQLDQDLRLLLGPLGVRPDVEAADQVAPSRAPKVFSDIDHLIAHKRSGAQFFVTLDNKTILKKRERLQALGIDARKPSEVPISAL